MCTKLFDNNRRGRRSLPLLFILQLFGAHVGWSGDTQQEELNDERSLRELSIWPESCWLSHLAPFYPPSLSLSDQYVSLSMLELYPAATDF